MTKEGIKSSSFDQPGGAKQLVEDAIVTGKPLASTTSISSLIVIILEDSTFLKIKADNRVLSASDSLRKSKNRYKHMLPTRKIEHLFKEPPS